MLLSRVSRSAVLARASPCAAARLAAVPSARSLSLAPQLLRSAAAPKPLPVSLRSVGRAYHVPARQSTYLWDATGVAEYSAGQSWLHWLMAAGIVTIVATVKISQNVTNAKLKEWGTSKAKLMHLHKSVALIMAAMIAPRLILRLVSFAPLPPPGLMVEVAAAHASHWALYAFMIVMPASGIAMGYYSGKGLPFFGWTLSGAKVPDGAKAKKFYGQHKTLGQLFTYLLPLHVLASFWHVFKGQNLFARFRWAA
jgi:cytochrome b561